MILLLKLAVTPLLVGVMSLAVRYWGPTLGSILMGLPWMTGPVLLILGMDNGNDWVAKACIGVHLGVVALAAYVWGYTWLARRHGWLASQIAGSLAFIGVALPAAALDVGALTAAVLAVASLLLVHRLVPPPPDARAPGRLPWWDIPARMATTAALVLLIATTADALGPVLSGIVATYPVILTVIGTFTHAQWGGGAATLLMRAVLISLLSFVAFFAVVAASIDGIGLVPAYVAAALASIGISTALLVARRLARPR